MSLLWVEYRIPFKSKETFNAFLRILPKFKLRVADCDLSAGRIQAIGPTPELVRTILVKGSGDHSSIVQTEGPKDADLDKLMAAVAHFMKSPES